MLSWIMSSDDCLRQLEWPSLKLSRDFLSVNLLYDIIFNKIAIKFSDFCSFFSRARWTALATTPSTRWQSAGQLGDQHSNAATGLKATLRVGHFNV